jgi:hypothetical protein
MTITDIGNYSNSVIFKAGPFLSSPKAVRQLSINKVMYFHFIIINSSYLFPEFCRINASGCIYIVILSQICIVTVSIRKKTCFVISQGSFVNSKSRLKMRRYFIYKNKSI